MGKGKGSFDHWAARVAVNKILFEIRGQVHEKVVRDAFRLAGNKLPGKFRLATLCFTQALTLPRSIRVCKKRRPASCWYHKVGGRPHLGGSEASLERKADTGGGAHNYGRLKLLTGIVYV